MNNVLINAIADSTVVTMFAIAIGVAAFALVVKIAFPKKTQVWRSR